MKSYNQMINWHVDQVEKNSIRYYEWPSKMAIAEAYGVSEEQVDVDVNQEKEYREDKRKEAQRKKHQEENEARRLANLKKRNHIETS